MADPMTVRFTIPQKPVPTAEAVAAALGDTVTEASKVGDIYEITFEPDGDNEADSLFLMFCEIGVHFPGAVLAD